MTDNVSMYPCLECGEDVPASECYDDLGVLMHAMGVTGQAEPHETGSEPGDLKRVDIQSFSSPHPVPPLPADPLRSRLVRVTQSVLRQHADSEKPTWANERTCLCGVQVRANGMPPGEDLAGHQAEAVVAALLQELQLREEWGNTWAGQGPAINRTRAEAEEALTYARQQFPDATYPHEVVHRLVGPWVSVSPNPEEVV